MGLPLQSLELLDANVQKDGSCLWGIARLGHVIQGLGLQSILLVRGSNSFEACGAQACLEGLLGSVDLMEIQARPNPQRAHLETAYEALRHQSIDAILAIGGGSVMDCAKVLGLWLHQRAGFAPLPFIVAPTCFGSGAEVTPFATVYEGHKKTSVADPRMKPSHIILDAKLGASLSTRSRVIGCLDALCQSVESFWSRQATMQSQHLSLEAIRVLAQGGWLSNPEKASIDALMLGSHLSGRAISMAKTTAAHALSYGLTSRFGVPHGQAVAMVMRRLWPSVVATQGPDARGVARVDELAGSKGIGGALERLFEVGELAPTLRGEFNKDTIPELLTLINPERLANFPFPLSMQCCASIYAQILGLDVPEASLVEDMKVLSYAK